MQVGEFQGIACKWHSRATGRAFAAIFVYLLTISSYAAAQDNAGQVVEPQTARVLFRATGALPDGAIRAIANLTLPERTVIPANIKPEDFITAQCGHLSETYKTLFIKANKDLLFRKEQQERPVIVPSCAYWRRNAEITVAADDTIDKIALREMDRQASYLFQKCEGGVPRMRCGSIEDVIGKLNPGVDLKSLKPGTKLMLPNITRAMVFRLDPSKFPSDPAPETGASAAVVSTWRTAIAKKFEAIINAAIDKAFGKDKSSRVTTATSNRAVEGVWIARPQSANEVKDANCRDANDLRGGSGWPFNITRVRDAIARTVERLRNRSANIAVERTLPRDVMVRVVDAGFDDYEHAIDERFRHVDRNEILDGAKQTNSENPDYIDARDGIAIDNSGILRSEPGFYEYHGIEVAELVLGGQEFRPDLNSVELPIRLQLVKAVRRDGIRPTLDASTLPNSFAYKPAVNSIHFSLSTTGTLREPILTQVNAKNVVVVAAAGNDHENLADLDVFPAALGGNGEGRGIVITVGASDANNRLAEFSNRGSGYVDLLAPGCDIRYTTRNGIIRREYGTSFAAPLVSFAVAALQSFGLDEAVEVKQRILVSVDYFESLQDVASGGLLNIEKALLLGDDLVQDKFGRISFVTWDRSQEFMLCKNDDLATDPNRVRKVTTIWRDGKLRLRFLKSDMSRMLTQARECEPGAEGLKILENGETTTKSWEDIADFVPGDTRFMEIPEAHVDVDR